MFEEYTNLFVSYSKYKYNTNTMSYLYLDYGKYNRKRDIFF